MEKGKEVINEPFWTHPDGGKEIIMNTYITKQQVIDAFDSPNVDWYYGDVDPESVISVIESIPAARSAGKWEYDHWCEFKCSNCGAWSRSEPYRGRENYCPNCGADMRGRKEE